MAKLSANYKNEVCPNDYILQGYLSYDEVLDNKKKKSTVQGKTFPYKDTLSNQQAWLKEIHQQEIDQEKKNTFEEQEKKREELE